MYGIYVCVPQSVWCCVVCFKVFDCDHDSVLSVSELRHMLSAMLKVHQLNQSPPAHCLVRACLSLGPSLIS